MGGIVSGTRKKLLIAIVKIPQKMHGNSPIWLCRCDCGNYAEVSEHAMLQRKRKSCGCQDKWQAKMIIQPHSRSGLLELIEFSGIINSHGETMWKCRCDCGNTVDVSWTNFRKEKVRSCGCLLKKRAKQQEKNISGKTFGMLKAICPTDEKSQDGATIWWCECECGAHVKVPINSLTTLHTQSCGCHKKSMLTKNSEVSPFQDDTNLYTLQISKPHPLNESGSNQRGVTKDNKSGKWRAHMIFQKRVVLNRTYNRLEDAIAARLEAERKYHAPILEKYKHIVRAVSEK